MEKLCSLLAIFSPLTANVSWSCNCSSQCSFIAITSVVVVSISIFVLVLVGRVRRKDKRKIIELEQRLLLSQMNPHFVFNSLTAIQSYIFRSDPYMAGKYLASFSKLVRLILENSRVQSITIAKEKETIEHYLDLQLLRFDSKFDYTIEVCPDIDPEHHLLPPMLAQPFIENAIEHGIIHLSTRGQIAIRYILQDNKIVLEVEDNGIGIKETAQLDETNRTKHQSMATRITRERLKNLSRIYGEHVDLKIIDLGDSLMPDSQGTLIRFVIPLIIK
ncbi:MAG: histidine kinase [Tenuifilaceae bacterium]|nr:histidine kinase [Tenuifilaceae bacterium]